MTSAGCIAQRPVPSRICCRQLNPSAITNRSGGVRRTAGSSTSSPSRRAHERCGNPSPATDHRGCSRKRGAGCFAAHHRVRTARVVADVAAERAVGVRRRIDPLRKGRASRYRSGPHPRPTVEAPPGDRARARDEGCGPRRGPRRGPERTLGEIELLRGVTSHRKSDTAAIDLSAREGGQKLLLLTPRPPQASATLTKSTGCKSTPYSGLPT